MYPDALSDEQLLDALARSGAEILVSCQLQLATLGDIPSDPRWRPPLPIRFHTQIGVLFLGALDAFDILCSVLRHRVSQQAFSLLRFQMESLAIIRWLNESDDQQERQHRSYQLACGQVRRFGTFMMQDAGREREALDQVKAVRDWGTLLREIAKDDGIPHLKGEPTIPQLFTHADVAGYPRHKMFSELGSHPGTAGLTLFAIRSGADSISYDLRGSVLERAFYISTSLWYLSKTAHAVATSLAWDAWLESDAAPRFKSADPVMGEVLGRRRALAEAQGL
jgi:hypothetical protein